MSSVPNLVALASARPDPDLRDATVDVVLAEDHASMRRSLRQLLDGEPGIRVVAEAPDLNMAITHVYGHHPDVLVLDLRMPNGSSIDLIRRIRIQAADTNVVVITMHDGRAYASQAHQAGALGYVLKDTADEELPEAVRRAARGEVYTSPRITPRAVPLGLS
jgi:two-component system, NarL family, response regulator NreC